MRTMLKVVCDVEAGNKAIVDGVLGQVIESVSAVINPESSYFLAENGKRSALFFFDMKSPADIPKIAEPLFLNLNAEVTFTPVMNHEELKKGIALWKESMPQ